MIYTIEADNNISMFDSAIQFLDDDRDLGLAFGHATLTITLTMFGKQVQVHGNLSDLYNWDFEGGATGTFFGQLLDPMGASLQAGMATLGGDGIWRRTKTRFAINGRANIVLRVPLLSRADRDTAGSESIPARLRAHYRNLRPERR